MTYYLAGPMTGYANFNFDAFEAAAKNLRSQGYKVINPAENHDGAQDLPYEQYLETAKRQVRQEAEEGIILLAGWQDSKGAVEEVGWALELGRNIVSYEWITGLGSPQNRKDPSALPKGYTGTAIGTVADAVERRLDSLANPLFLALLDYVADVHKRKAAGYSGMGQPDTWKNFREAENWGLSPSQGCTMRVGDKYRRAQNLLKDPDNDQVGESLFDTLTDLANYVLILVCLLWEEGKITMPVHDAFDPLVDMQRTS